MILAIRSRGRALKIPLIVTACYLVEVFYGTLLDFKTHRAPNLPGWYLWPVGGTIAMIIAAGLGRASMAMIMLLGLVDLYGVAGVMLPYYAGLVERGHVDASQFPEALSRLHLSAPLAIIWIAATIGIPLIAGWRAIDRPAHNPHRRTPENA